MRKILQQVSSSSRTARRRHVVEASSKYHLHQLRYKGTSNRKGGALDAAIKGKEGPSLSSNNANVTASNVSKAHYKPKVGSIKIKYTDANPPPIIPSPPPPPPRRGIRRYIWQITLAGTIGLFAFIYSLGEDEDDGFWKDVESGRILMEDDDDEEEYD